MLQDLIEKLKQELPGYHFEIIIFPSGGMIDAEACEECGTIKSESSSWRYEKGTRRNIDDAVADIKKKLSGS